MYLFQIGLVGILRGIFLHEKTEHRLFIFPLIEIENALSSCKILCSPLDNQSFCRKIDAKYSKKRYGIFVAHLSLTKWNAYWNEDCMQFMAARALHIGWLSLTHKQKPTYSGARRC